MKQTSLTEIAAIDDPRRFILDNTALLAPPLVPEVRLHLASEDLPIWRFGEEELAERGLPSPFWAFAWAGGQALARHLLDNPELVAGKRVLDFGAGSGLVGIAVLKAGAASALAADIDRFAVAACKLNAGANGVEMEATDRDLVGDMGVEVDTVLVGDMCYEQPLASEVEAWLRALAEWGADILIGDPGRTYLPKDRLTRIADYRVQTNRELEDNDVRRTSVWRLA